jgi:hypothetical protein
VVGIVMMQYVLSLENVEWSVGMIGAERDGSEGGATDPALLGEFSTYSYLTT